jgi:heat shock protein HslJ
MTTLSNIFLGAAITPFFLSCKPFVQDEPETVTYWVNSLEVPCQGVAPASFLQVQRDSFRPGEWKNFYTDIGGVEFEAGFIYKMLVQEERIPPEQVPADCSSIRYTLIEVIEKNPDQRLRLNDIWVLESIRKTAIDSILIEQGLKRPYLEIHLAEKRILCNDGCNEISADLRMAGEEKLSIDNLLTTKMACGDMILSGDFIRALAKVRAYRLEGLRLVLFDTEELELLNFHKSD